MHSVASISTEELLKIEMSNIIWRYLIVVLEVIHHASLAFIASSLFWEVTKRGITGGAKDASLKFIPSVQATGRVKG